MVFAWALIILVIATVVFHFASPWWFTEIASNWAMVDDTVNITFWVTGFVFVAVNLFMAYAVVRFRHNRPGKEKAQYEPENKKLEWWLTAVTSVGIAAMLAPGLAVWAKFVTVPEDASVVEVLGQQWAWSYRFPGRDGNLGASDNKLVSVDNPFGMDPDDPQGQDDILVNAPELHLPVNKPVKFLLRAKDVNHQFAVPQFRVKMDMVPGMVTYFWATPTRTGSFDALCEQLCGVAHFAMRGRVVVDEETVFQDWIAAQPTFAQTQADMRGDPAAGQALYATCSTCHGAQAEGNKELNSPKLAGQAGWYLARQLQSFKAGVRGAHEKDVYAKQMIPFASMLGDDAAVRNVVAYIGSLPDERPKPSVYGNPDRGKSLYTSCVSCHGIILAGWSTNSKYALLGAMRGAAQMVAYEIAMGFALVGVVMAAGSLNLGEIIEAQRGGPLSYFFWWLLPLFVVYFVSGIAETNRAPFDVVEGESEIVAGFHVEYSGMAFAVFFVAEYVNMILISALTSIFFFGGWLSPFEGYPLPGLLTAPSFFWLFLKISFFLFCFLWFRATFPRYRYDQIMRLGWKVFIPVTLVWIVVEGVFLVYGIGPWRQ